ncbi:MAG: hypothetical protein QXQ70_09085 [Candidatus Caldarchaeum sp.]
MAKAGREIIKGLTAPELGEIVREELNTALQPLTVKIDYEITGLKNKIEEMDKRLTTKIDELDKRLTSEISLLRSELQYAPRVAVLEAKLAEIEKKLTKTQ